MTRRPEKTDDVEKLALEVRRLVLQVDRMELGIERLTDRIGDIVGALDNVLAKLQTLKDTIVSELEQIRDLVRNGQTDPTQLAEAESKLDEAIASVSQMAEDAVAEGENPEEPV